MRAYEIRGGAEITIDVRPVTGTFDPVPPVRDEVELRRVQDEILLCRESSVISVEGADVRAHAALTDTVDSGYPRMAWCVRGDRGRLTIHVRQFHGALLLDQPLVIGIDDACVDELRRSFGVSGGALEAARWLEDRLFVPGRDVARRRAAISGGLRPTADAFRMFGRGISLDVRREAEKLRIDHLIKNAPVGQAPVHLLDAPLSFADVTATGEVAAAARHALEQAVRTSGSYLRIWSTYADMEREAILRRARRIGAFRYDAFEPLKNGGFRFVLADTSDLEARLAGLLDDDRFELEAGEAAPRWDTLEDVRGRVSGRFAGPLMDFRLEARHLDLGAPEGDEEAKPPPRGYLYLSLTGDRARLRRREQAEERLRTGTNPMPSLGLLIEGQSGPRTTRKPRSERSAAVLDAFGGRPTERQLEAIRIAINTPDIALIQGPPGTGKTKVITALGRRLAELADEGAEVSHRILMSSAQHDAVENVVQRTEVFGLPAVKVGGRRGDEGAGVDGVDVFRKDRIERLRASLERAPEEERTKKARQIAVACLRAPAPPAETAVHLRDLADSVSDLLSPALRDRLRRRVEELTRSGLTASEPEEQELRLSAVRGIRVDPDAFGDDGPIKARKALLRLSAILSPEERQVLETCASWAEPASPPWLDRVESVRDALLDRLMAPPPRLNVEPDAETRTLLIEIVDALEDRRARSALGEQGVLAAYLSDLENDPAMLREAIEHYTVVLAATCQQSAGRAMRAVREVETGWPDFETVIVDEAARANPLDLFIPMTMAKRRVVLVGDHRQLPHMLEPEVERDVNAAVQAGTLAHEAETALKESLFGRLWEILGRLEAHDGIPRRVRLDTQYRMHPVLGDFVSRMFYEKRMADQPAGARLESGAPPEQFAHELPSYQRGGNPCVAAWLDVPGGPGQWERRGRSKLRPVEARLIAREVKSLLQAAPQLTIGVIAFYSAQVTAIGEALIREEIAERTEAGAHRIADRFRSCENQRGELVERLRLGSVDAFQGKEFDVVLLSVTRSNDLPAETDEDRRRKYGHLLLENRLCVAMSRQRRLLIVVGDRDFATATPHLAPLRDFSTLCEGAHGIVRH